VLTFQNNRTLSWEGLALVDRSGNGELLVVGGGIGGLASAIALARAGCQVRVLERSTEFQEIGAGIELAPNATRLLEGWGLLDEIVEEAVRPRRLVLKSAISGEELTALDLQEPFRARYGGPYLVCHRNTLLRVLFTACKRDTSIVLETGRCVTDIDIEDTGVAVECADGSRHHGIALIGADGLWSRVRQEVVADKLCPWPYVSYRGAVPLDEVSNSSPLDEVVGWIGPELHFVQYALGVGGLYNQVAVFKSDEVNNGQDWGSPKEFDRKFAKTCEFVRSAVKDVKRDTRWYMYDREPGDRWVRGRIALMGDAAHPMLQYLAQGACQALEDAAALGAAITTVDRRDWPTTGVVAAFERYERSRIQQGSRVQRNARIWGDIWHTTDPLTATLRDELFKFRPPTDYRYTDWLYLGKDGGLPEPNRPATSVLTQNQQNSHPRSSVIAS